MVRKVFERNSVDDLMQQHSARYHLSLGDTYRPFIQISSGLEKQTIFQFLLFRQSIYSTYWDSIDTWIREDLNSLTVHLTWGLQYTQFCLLVNWFGLLCNLNIKITSKYAVQWRFWMHVFPAHEEAGCAHFNHCYVWWFINTVWDH